MADIDRRQGSPVPENMVSKYKDMLDGTHALVVAADIGASDGEGIGRDVPVWTKKMAPSGIIIFHDYGTRKCPLVKVAVDAWAAAAQWEFLNQCGSSRAYRRPAE